MSRPINFTDTTVTKKPYVEIDGIEYEVQDGTYEGGTDLNANTFNKMQDELNMFRNLINCKYGTGFTTTFQGITYTKNSDDSFTLNGTATGGTSHIVITDIMSLNGTYTISLVDNSNSSIFMRALNIDNSYSIDLSTETKALTTNTINSRYVLYIYVKDGTVLNNVKIYPQLEQGTTATSYVPYVPNNVRNIVNNKNYSIDEQKIGTWINGKPIYQKTFTYTPDLASRYLYQHGISNIDQIINSEAMLQRINGQFVPLSMIYPNVNVLDTLIEWSSGYQITKTDIETWIGSNMFEQMDTTNYGIVVTIQYTKTTD